MLKSISPCKPTSSTLSTTSLAKPQTLLTTQTIKPSSSSLFLKKEKEMLDQKDPETIYQHYEFGYLDLVYLNPKLTKLSKFADEIIQILKTFKQGPIFVKFHTIMLEKDE